jgi:S-sulfosulfanyl-L-cysteine sulfohydrolase
MMLERRQFLQLLSAAAVAGLLPKTYADSSDFYKLPNFGNVRLLHITDSHAQLLPIYFREPNVNIGVHEMAGKAPHLVGDKLLSHFNVQPNTIEAHALTYLNFAEAAKTYGKVGGFAHLATLIKQLRGSFGIEKTLLLDGGDTWQGSGTALWTRGKDMVEACNLLGVDVMTGHWEFTYLEKEVFENIKEFKGEFVAHNIKVKEEAAFDYQYPYDSNSYHAFKPYTIKELNGIRVAVIGQAFPYTPIANPARFIPNWTFGINEQELQALVNKIKETEKPSLIVLISHNGMDVDLKLASKVSGINVILGGHTHDGVPMPIEIKNPQGMTLVTNAGSNGKFVGILDFEVKENQMVGYKYRLLPVFANMLPADPDMSKFIEKTRSPFLEKLQIPLATTEELLYRRGNFNGTFDQVICNALRAKNDAQISLSPGFRWGTTILPNQTITMENVLDQTAMTYPETYIREMSGEELKMILEDVCDNLFNRDPYRQQGGDMVRLGGLDYVCNPLEEMGKRISNMTLDNGETIEATKKYKVAGWATVGSQSQGEPIWETVASYLKDIKTVKLTKFNHPKIIGIDA